MNRILLAASALVAVPAFAQTSPPQPPQAATASPSSPPVATTIAPPSVVPPPVAPRRHKPSPAELRVRTANAKATQEPAAPAFVNAVQVYPYGEGVLYRLFAAPERVSDIALQPGEAIVSVAAGDTARWTVGDTTSGSGESRRVHILVKPFAAGLSTNLVITTDRRAYHLQLDSTPATAMAALSWTYPQDEMIAIRRQQASAEAARPLLRNHPPTHRQPRQRRIAARPRPPRLLPQPHRNFRRARRWSLPARRAGRTSDLTAVLFRSVAAAASPA